MVRAAIYIRVSTERQAKEGDSVPAQREALRKYVAERDDLVLAGEYMDDGISGQKLGERGELQRLLDDVKEKKIDLILFTKLDRWFRSIRHYVTVQEILDKYGVQWLAIWEPIYDTTTPAGRLIVNQMMSIAQFEAENTGARIRAVNEYKVRRGEFLTGNPPFGYRIEEKHLVPDENAETVRKVFEFYSFNGCLLDAVRYAISIGLGRTRASIRKILANEIYTGTYRGNPDFCPPIISRELYDDVRRKLSMNIRSSRTHEYIFSGLLVCASCGHRMEPNNKKWRGWQAVYYRCRAHYDPPHRCPYTRGWAEEKVEAYLLEHLEDLAVTAQVESKKRPDNSVPLARIDRRLERLKELFLNEMIDLNDYKQEREKLLEERMALERAETPQKHDLEFLRVFLRQGWKEAYSALNTAEKRYLWQSVIKEIRCGDDLEVIFL